ncbi:MAG: NTP transferase domain-containing protein [Phycisphaera sp.]|nr:NTP transferase domain-containing protein [Phycisphaera sp.]
MRYAVIMAGGSGTRLWPMSRASQPKQLIPFIRGRSLLEISSDRLEGLVPASHRYICAGATHQDAILEALPAYTGDRYLAEPTGRDTLNAVGFAAAVLHSLDPDAVMAVFTADHLIEPVEKFQKIVSDGFDLVEQHPDTLVTFGIQPTHPATGYGYLELGKKLTQGDARQVVRFKEKPDASTAQKYLASGGYLWNSGMFVWHTGTMLDCIRRFRPENHTGLMKIAGAWQTPDRNKVLESVYPTLPKVSIDYAVMEPASKDDKVHVAALPMDLTWLDVGSWPSFADTCEKDAHGNALGTTKHLLHDTRNTLVASNDPDHLIATIGCENLVIIHTQEATLVCHVDKAEEIKTLHKLVGEKVSKDLL